VLEERFGLMGEGETAVLCMRTYNDVNSKHETGEYTGVHAHIYY